MRGSRNFRQGGPGQSDKKSSDNVFFLFSANFTEVKWLFPIETHITCDFPGGSGPPVPPSGSALEVHKALILRNVRLCRTKADAHHKFGFWVLIGRLID